MPILARAGAAAARGFGMLGKIAAAVDEYFKYVTLLLPGNGTNGAQNNTFLDSSTNNFTITRNGNTTQGTFAPYGSNWSNYFDGTGDYLSFTKQTTTSAFTCECWFYRGEDVSGYHIVFSGNNLGSVNADNAQLSVSNAGAVGLTLAGTAVIAQTGTAVIKNQWNHIAWVRSGTSCAIFVNGSRIATGTSSSALNVVSVGTYLSGYEPNGYVSNARINTTAVYDPSLTTCTVPTAPLTAITGTYLLTCQSNRFVDNSASPLTITVNGNPSVQRFSPFNPTAPYAAGTDGGSGYFDGSGDYLRYATNTSSQFSLGTGDFTDEAWVFPTAFAGGSTVISIQTQTNGGAGNSYALYLDSTGRPGVLAAASSGGYAVNFLGTAIPLNTWTHLAVTRSGNTFTLWRNGVSDGTATSSVSITQDTTSGYGGWNIGGSPQTGQSHNGYISNARLVKGTAVYTAAFTPPTAPLTAITNTSLLLNFTNGGIIDNAMMNDLETVGNAQISTSVSKFGGGSMAFDGTGDWLKANTGRIADFGTGDFTIEAWVYLLAHDGDQSTVFAGGLDFSSYTQPNVNIDTNGTVNLNGNQPTSNALSLNTWTHIAVSRSSGTCRIFINGVQGSSATNTLNYNGIGCYVGVRVGGSVFGDINGYIDDLRITKGYARYTANFTPPSAPFPLQ